jgi:hypothetical protein
MVAVIHVHADKMLLTVRPKRSDTTPKSCNKLEVALFNPALTTVFLKNAEPHANKTEKGSPKNSK